MVCGVNEWCEQHGDGYGEWIDGDIDVGYGCAEQGDETQVSYQSSTRR